MKLGTILKATYIAGVLSGAVGLAAIATTAKGIGSQVRKFYEARRACKEASHVEDPPK